MPFLSCKQKMAQEFLFLNLQLLYNEFLNTITQISYKLQVDLTTGSEMPNMILKAKG